jgi:hypothetical protein
MVERLIIDPDKAKRILNEYGENALGWDYREEKADLDRMTAILKNRLVDPILRTHRLQMPDPVVGFDDAGNQNVLAYYNTVPNAHGIPDEIIFNTAQYDNREGKKVWRYGKWSQYETAAHEMAHGLLNFIAKIENRKIPTHGKKFCELLESWGLHPVPGIGCHAQVADSDKPFGILMKEQMVARPDDVPRGEVKIKTDWFRPEKGKGRSTLTGYVCPSCNLKVRLGIKGDPELIHAPCSEKAGNPVFLVRR